MIYLIILGYIVCMVATVYLVGRVDEDFINKPPLAALVGLFWPVVVATVVIDVIGRVLQHAGEAGARSKK